MVRKFNDLSRNARHEIILVILETHCTGYGLTTKEIQEIIEQQYPISFKTLSRDLDYLSQHFPITEDRVSGKRVWRFLLDEEFKTRFSLLRLRYIKELVEIFSKRPAQSES
jgi:hypothetical protein